MVFLQYVKMSDFVPPSIGELLEGKERKREVADRLSIVLPGDVQPANFERYK